MYAILYVEGVGWKREKQMKEGSKTHVESGGHEKQQPTASHQLARSPLWDPCTCRQTFGRERRFETNQGCPRHRMWKLKFVVSSGLSESTPAKDQPCVVLGSVGEESCVFPSLLRNSETWGFHQGFAHGFLRLVLLKMMSDGERPGSSWSIPALGATETTRICQGSSSVT
jgi:hypothetical protein